MSTKKLTTEQFIQRSVKIHGKKFTYSKVNYINSKTPVVITCVKHGDISINPNNHINNKSGCPHCNGKVKKTTEQFIEQVKQKHGNNFTFKKTKYVNDYTKVIITCKKHGDFDPRPTNILRGSGCLRCALEVASIRNRKSQEDFIKEASQIHNNFYDYSLVKYINNRTKIKIICPKHGVFEQQPNIHTDQKCGCQICKQSRGEKSIRTWLITNMIIFEQQKKFENCRHKNQLSYDFYLPQFKILIEFQGIQHYKKSTWPSNDSLKTIRYRDNIKKQYAKNNGFQLIEIRYNQNIEKILKNKLCV